MYFLFCASYYLCIYIISTVLKYLHFYLLGVLSMFQKCRYLLKNTDLQISLENQLG